MVSVGVIKVRCDACKEVITGKYIHFSDGSIFCLNCYHYLPKCNSCKKPISGGEDQFIDGLCPLCYKRSPKCSICQKAIIGSYTRFSDGSISCDTCMEKYVSCDRCGKPVPKYTKVRGNVLCRHCLAHAPRCAVCSNPIIQTYWVIDKERVCDTCYKNYERCDLCGMPSQILFTVYNKKICYTCKENSKRCTACGLPIIGRYYIYKNQTGFFCEHCEQVAPHCDSCSRPVGLRYFIISDGRKICLECEASAISSDKELADVMLSAKEGMAELGIKINSHVNFRLLSKKVLDRRIVDAQAEVVAGKNLGLFERKGEKMSIFLESHLPLQMALGTVCHELAHAWQSENVTVEDQSLLMREGFCEWVSYKVLLRYGFVGQAEMIKSRDDVYGRGFQKFLEYEKTHGIEALLEWVKTTK